MKKVEMIKVVIESKTSSFTEAELNGMPFADVKELYQLAKDVVPVKEDSSEEAVITPEALKKEMIAEGVVTKEDKIIPVDVKTVEPVVEPEVEEFKSDCGFPFDCANSSDCFTVCKMDAPQNYAACLANFEKCGKAVKTRKTTARAKGPAKGRSAFGHLAGSQAGLLDDALFNAGVPVTLAEMAEIAGAKVPRSGHHYRHLTNDLAVIVMMTVDKKIFLAEKFPELCGVEGTVIYSK